MDKNRLWVHLDHRLEKVEILKSLAITEIKIWNSLQIISSKHSLKLLQKGVYA